MNGGVLSNEAVASSFYNISFENISLSVYENNNGLISGACVFCYIDGVEVNNSIIDGNNSANYVGALLGEVGSSYINNVEIDSLSFIICILLSIIIFFINYLIVMNYLNSNILYYSGQIFNILASILSVAMWIPQLYTSYKIKKEGSLSLIALFIHCIGCILTVIYQVILSKQDFTVGLPYLLGAILELFVIIVCMYYKNKSINV